MNYRDREMAILRLDNEALWTELVELRRIIADCRQERDDGLDALTALAKRIGCTGRCAHLSVELEQLRIRNNQREELLAFTQDSLEAAKRNGAALSVEIERLRACHARTENHLQS